MQRLVSRKLAAVLFLGILPLASLYLVALHLLDFAEGRQVKTVRSDLRQELLVIAERTSQEGFYFSLCNNLFKKLRLTHQDGRTAASEGLIKRCARIFQTDFRAYLFDERGELVQTGDAPQPNSFIIGRIWAILAETPGYKPGEDEVRHLKRIQVLLGAESNAGRLKNLEGQLISLKKKKADGYFYWQRFTPSGKAGLIILALPVDTTGSILQKHSGGWRPDFRLSYWNHEVKKPLFSDSEDDTAIYIRNLLENDSEGFVSHAGRLWTLLNTRAGIFAGSVPVEASRVQGLRGMINLGFYLTLVLMLTVFFNRRINLQNTSIRIGNKLTAILLVAIAFPVSALTLTGIIAVFDHEKVLLSRIEKEQKQKLSEIEDEFVTEEQGLKKICNDLKQRLIENSSVPEFASSAQKLIQERQIVRIELRGLDGDLLSIFNTGGYLEGLEKSNDGFCRHLIKNRLAQRLLQERVELKRPPDEVFTDLYTSSDFGFAQIAEAPDRVHVFRFGQNEMFWYWSYITIPGHPAALLSIFQAIDIARENYLQRVLKANAGNNEKIGVFDNRKKIWLQGSPVESAPIRDLIDATMITGLPENRVIELGRGKFIAQAMPGTALAPFSLLSLISDSLVRSQLQNLLWALIGSIVLILAVALAIAQVLARTFKEPIDELARGMRQIQERGNEAKVSIDSGDEFGELGMAFNQMVDDLNEMQLARIVQESLFPQAKPQIEGFDAAIFNLTATDLGGDYCDVIKVSEKQWLLLIGDVSGHGTPAALCMAMVKAAIFKACQDGLQFCELPESLSGLLLKTLGRKKMMTMLFVLLDTGDNSLQIINSGHNWPLIIRKDGGFDEIRVVGLPLGVKTLNKKRDNVLQRLAPGDTLFCYTDALIECRSPADEVYGHERLYADLVQLRDKSADEIIEHLQVGWHRFIAGGEREDDLTMLVVKNCRQKEEVA